MSTINVQYSISSDDKENSVNRNYFDSKSLGKENCNQFLKQFPSAEAKVLIIYY
jgi:hypothetical protein